MTKSPKGRLNGSEPSDQVGSGRLLPPVIQTVHATIVGVSLHREGLQSNCVLNHRKPSPCYDTQEAEDRNDRKLVISGSHIF
jgi:hypothetical protein